MVTSTITLLSTIYRRNIKLTLALKMTTEQVVETSVTVNNNSPIQDYVHPEDQTQPTFEMTPGLKPFSTLFYLQQHLFFICSNIFYLQQHLFYLQQHLFLFAATCFICSNFFNLQQHLFFIYSNIFYFYRV